MEGLLGNPVIQGLLGGGGPMGVRAQSQQQLAQMMPRGGGGMIGAPSAPAPDRSGAAAIASLGDSVASVITHRAEKNAAEEAEKQEIAMLTGVVGTLPEDLQTKVAPMLQSASGRKMLMGLVGDRLKPSERRIITGADGQDYYEDTKEPVLPGVKAPVEPPETREINQGGNLVTQEWDGTKWATVAQAPRFQPRAATLERYTLYKNGKGQDVTVGSKTEQALLNSGWSLTPSDTPVPGRDIPLPEAVAAQKRDIALAGAGMNESQSKAAGFADRMAASDAIINRLAAEGTDLYNRMASGVPLAGNYLVSEEFKQFDQAKRDFVNAILRRESGAVIADSEFDNADKQYFPQPNDGPDVIAQKAANRARATLGIMRAAGPNYEPDVKPSEVPSPSDILGKEVELNMLIDKYAGEQ
jgi:hypothetical protein